MRYAALNAERAWIDPARVANTWSAERLLAWVAQPKSAASAPVTHSGPHAP